MGCVHSKITSNKVYSKADDNLNSTNIDLSSTNSTINQNFDEAPGKLHPVPSQAHGITAIRSFFNPKHKPQIFEYSFINHIGRGAQSDVFLVYNTEDGQNYAAKVYEQSYLLRQSIGDAEPPIQKLIHEVQIMSVLHHPNCLNLVELLEDEYTKTVTLILPFADDGALSSFSYKSNPLTEASAKDYFFQIALGLRHIHAQNIIHRDLKPDNILKFKDGHVAIADFSVSIMLPDPDKILDDTDGTPAFYSPEECLGEGYKGKPTDVWAYGMMLYVMIYGKLPFFDPENGGAFYSQFFTISKTIIEDEFEFPEKVPISDELKDLFSHLLDKNPETRYTIQQVLEHPWFAEYFQNYVEEDYNDYQDQYQYEESMGNNEACLDSFENLQ